jgi:AcrR family transcriptional regulator
MKEPVKGRSEAGRAREYRARATRQRVVDAAIQLFVEHGYVATTVTALAARAGVSPATIYQAFGTKQAVLERALDVVIAGDDAPVPVLERAWMREASSETDPRRRLVLVVRGVTAIAARASPLMEVLRDAAAVEPEMRSVMLERHRRRYESQEVMVKALATGRPLRTAMTPSRAADIFFALVGHDLYRLLVLERGWTLAAWQRWLVDNLERELFDEAEVSSPRREHQLRGPRSAESAAARRADEVD